MVALESRMRAAGHAGVCWASRHEVLKHLARLVKAKGIPTSYRPFGRGISTKQFVERARVAWKGWCGAIEAGAASEYLKQSTCKFAASQADAFTKRQNSNCNVLRRFLTQTGRYT